jgi:hypothetical protein
MLHGCLHVMITWSDKKTKTGQADPLIPSVAACGSSRPLLQLHDSIFVDRWSINLMSAVWTTRLWCEPGWTPRPQAVRAYLATCTYSNLDSDQARLVILAVLFQHSDSSFESCLTLHLVRAIRIGDVETFT